MSQRKALLVLMLVIGLTTLVGGCKSKRDMPTDPPPPPAPVERPDPKPPVEVVEETPAPIVIEEHTEPSIQELNAAGHLKTIYFEFDKHDLTDAARATLRSNADWMRTHAGHSIVIEGNCDERGSIEYNLALGERRANAVREFLTSLGVARNDLRIVSYGEERPAVEGNHESAWSKNRRADFVFE